MKELSVEEKAKAYDKLFVKAQQIYNKENDVLIIHTIEDLFPELKESEDERIRKELIDFLEYYRLNNVLDSKTIFLLTDSVAWLEKQGEQPSDTDNKFIRMRETKPKDISEFLDRLTIVEQEFLWEHIAKIRELDKEEQNSAWSEEDKKKIDDIIEYLDCYNDFDHGDEPYEEYRARFDSYIKFMESLKKLIKRK